MSGKLAELLKHDADALVGPARRERGARLSVSGLTAALVPWAGGPTAGARAGAGREPRGEDGLALSLMGFAAQSPSRHLRWHHGGGALRLAYEYDCSASERPRRTGGRRAAL